MTRGKLITLEGTEGAGKSTALSFIQSYLERVGKKLIVTREPGGTDFSEKIRDLLLHSKSNECVQSSTELLLMFAGRAQHIQCCIEPALHSGQWVLSDRYIDASYAYQGGGRNIEKEIIAYLDHYIVGNLYPDLTLLLDVPVEQGMARAEQRGKEKDRIEQEQISFFQRVRDAYLERARNDPKRIRVIDASKEVVQVQSQLQQVLDHFLMEAK